MSCSTIVNSIGLVIDIVGALILFRFGLAPKIDVEGHVHLILEQVDEGEIALAKRYKSSSSIGIILIGIGFLFQLISNFLN